MSLAIFDLDNTLLSGDSDYLWGQFLSEQGIVEHEEYQRENQRFYDEYRRGALDIFEFLAFQLRPLAAHDMDTLLGWRKQFVVEKIEPIVLSKARDLIAQHRGAGRTLVIITATNSFVTEPIAQLLDVPNLIATEPELIKGRYTGRVAGVPCFREGKVVRLEEWMKSRGFNLVNSWFYSDSLNDLPLLEMVTHPVAVDPDETLAEHAGIKEWPVISLR